MNMFRVARCVLVAVAFVPGCASPGSELATHDAAEADDWATALIERSRGPANSDAITIDLLIREADGSQRLLAEGLVGSILPLPRGRAVFSCQNNSVMATRGPVLITLDGTTRALLPHPGYVRECSTVGTGSEVLIHYNLAGPDGLRNLVRIFDASGTVIVEQELRSAGAIDFRVAGQDYRIQIPAPMLPG